MTDPEASERMTPNSTTVHRPSPEPDCNDVSPMAVAEVADAR
jgi:hypothetical protein